jgi:hypothetical protein
VGGALCAYGGVVETDDHAGEIVCGEAGEGVVDKCFACCLGILGLPDQVDGFLVGADIP